MATFDPNSITDDIAWQQLQATPGLGTLQNAREYLLWATPIQMANASFNGTQWGDWMAMKAGTTPQKIMEFRDSFTDGNPSAWDSGNALDNALINQAKEVQRPDDSGFTPVSTDYTGQSTGDAPGASSTSATAKAVLLLALPVIIVILLLALAWNALRTSSSTRSTA